MRKQTKQSQPTDRRPISSGQKAAEQKAAEESAWQPWRRRVRAGWRVPPRGKPSGWAPKYFRIRRGSRKGAYRHDNAPYLAGMMDIITRPGCVQANIRAGGQMGKSTLSRVLMAYWAHTDPAPMGLTLPNRDKGRQICKQDILPMFRHTPALRALIASQSRDALIESISLVNGFQLDSMWSGSDTSMSANPYQRVINDEVDKYEPWTGEEADAIAATEGRLTSYGDRRLQVNTSTPTTTAGAIHRLFSQSTVQLHYHVPCPHCGHHQPLRWGQLKYMDRQCAEASLEAARVARGAGLLSYAIAWNADRRGWTLCDEATSGSAAGFESAAAFDEHIHWLGGMLTHLATAGDRRELADVLMAARDRAIWYECDHCRGRIAPADKAAMIRKGRWTTLEGGVVDADGVEYADAQDVQRWPVETRIGFAINAMACTWIHWGALAREWLGAQGDPARLFFFTTFRLGEPFEFRSKRQSETVFSAKCARAALDEGVVPAWAYYLLCAIDTQPDHFYAVVRAWGGGLRSQRVWHGKLMDFNALDHLLYAQTWPVDGGEFPPMPIARALIDSGGTLDQWISLPRTQQVYQWAIPRQQVVTVIKGANRPGPGLYWPMKNPMSSGGKIDVTALRALMVDPHKANDLLAEMITAGLPSSGPPAPALGAFDGDGAAVEQWTLNRRDDPQYNAHMAAVQRTVDPKSRLEIWTPKASGVRHDYRDAEMYQVVLAYLCNVHLLPDEAGVLQWKRREKAMQQAAPPAAGGGEYVERFRRR